MTIHYGKAAVSVYRTDGVSTLFAAEVDLDASDETGTVDKGMYRLMDGGLRYVEGKWPTEPLPFFDPAGTVTIYDAASIPPELLPADIPRPAEAPANS